MKAKYMNFFMLILILMGTTFVLTGCESEQEKKAREQDERIKPKGVRTFEFGKEENNISVTR